MNGKQYIGRNALSLEKFDEVGPVAGISLLVDDDTEYFAGSRDGYVMDIECPYGTQVMANTLLENLKGRTYKGFRADAAKMDKSAELGDGVTIKGMYSVLAAREVTFGPGYYSDIEAPGGNELLHEFPYESETRRIAKKNLAAAKSSIEKTINSITLDVTGALGGQAKIELKVNDKVQSSGDVDLSKVRQSFAEDESSITISAGLITFNGNTFVVNSTNFGVTANGTVTATNANISGTINASAGVFDSVTIRNSSLGGTLNANGTFTGTHSGGSLSGTGGSYYGGHYNGSVSGCTLGNSTGGTYVGTVSGGTLNSCSTGSTSLTTWGGSISNSNGAMLRGNSAAGLVGASSTVWCRNGSVAINGGTTVYGSLTCTGDKPRTIFTDDFGPRQLDAYETPLPTFSDYGTAKLDETGVFYVVIDPILAETVNNVYIPTVFLTKYGDGDIWVENVAHDIVTVRGTPGLSFAWETLYAQGNARLERMRVMAFDYMDVSHENDFDIDASIAYEHSAENIDYALGAYEYFTEFERSLTA